MDLNVVLGIGAFLVVAGYAGLEWLRPMGEIPPTWTTRRSCCRHRRPA